MLYSLPINRLRGLKGFKKGNKFTFTDIASFSSMEKNRDVKRIEQINAIGDWCRSEKLLMITWLAGKRAEVTEVYNPGKVSSL